MTKMLLGILALCLVIFVQGCAMLTPVISATTTYAESKPARMLIRHAVFDQGKEIVNNNTMIVNITNEAKKLEDTLIQSLSQHIQEVVKNDR